jgi:hypothetical protein
MTAHHIEGHLARMNNSPAGRTPRVPDPERYEIRVSGHLAGRWGAWFDGMTVTANDDGTTVIHGPVVDQSALHGLLRKLCDLGLTLVSVTATVADPTAERTTDRN